MTGMQILPRSRNENRMSLRAKSFLGVQNQQLPQFWHLVLFTEKICGTKKRILIMPCPCSNCVGRLATAELSKSWSLKKTSSPMKCFIHHHSSAIPLQYLPTMCLRCIWGPNIFWGVWRGLDVWGTRLISPSAQVGLRESTFGRPKKESPVNTGPEMLATNGRW